MSCWLTCTWRGQAGAYCCSAAALLRQIHPVTLVDLERKRIARELLADVRRLDRQSKTASQAIRTAVRDHGTTLTEVFGVGPVLAAKLVATPATSPASQTATTSPAPPAPPHRGSSGDVRRYRLNRGGNRQLTTALHLIAVCRIRDPSPGQAFYQPKLAEAKTPEEAPRSLKRHLANIVYHHLVSDHRHRTRPVDTQRRYQVTSAQPVGAFRCPPAAGRQINFKAPGQ